MQFERQSERTKNDFFFELSKRALLQEKKIGTFYAISVNSKCTQINSNTELLLITKRLGQQKII